MKAVETVVEMERSLLASGTVLLADLRYSTRRGGGKSRWMLIVDEIDPCPGESPQQVVLLCVNHKTSGEALVRRRIGQVRSQISDSLMSLWI